MKKTQMRRGIAMLELIFAIVILGIIMMSAPMLIQVATKSAYVAMQQESIAAAASEIGMILTRHWDEEDTDENLSAPILKTNGVADLNNERLYPDGNGTGVRIGTPVLSQRSFLTSLGGRINATIPSNFTAEVDFDDIDDYNGNNSELTVYNSEATEASIGDYIDTDINIQTTVSYIDDTLTSGTYAGSSETITLNNPFNRTAPTGTSNIKLVNIRLTTNSTTPELEKTIILNAFSCNIGTYALDERSF